MENKRHPGITHTIIVTSNTKQTRWVEDGQYVGQADTTLFSVMERYLTKGVTTEILSVHHYYNHSIDPGRQTARAAILWDYHLHTLGRDIDSSAVGAGKRRAAIAREMFNRATARRKREP